MEWWLPLIWAGVLGTAVALYVILDGFDLGLAMLFPFTKNERERDQMVRTVAPFWDGNETWLVLGGGGLWVAFPRAYAIIMPALYVPVITMLLALVFRGVAFEFRLVAEGAKKYWNAAFCIGSLVAALTQGMILGGLIQGIRVENGEFAGGPFDWATPFALLCGFGLAAGYALLGATWLLMKADGEVGRRARKQAVWALLAVMLLMGAVSLYTPLAFDRIATRWFTAPNIYLLWPVPITTVLIAWALWHGLQAGWERVPFLASIALFMLGYLGLVVSSFPYLVPPSLTIWEVAAHPSSQMFMLVGTLVLLPIILAYTAMSYWVFRGKTKEGEAYHH